MGYEYGWLRCLRTHVDPVDGVFTEKLDRGGSGNAQWNSRVIASIERTKLRVIIRGGRRIVCSTENGQVAYKVTVKDHHDRDPKWIENVYWLYGNDSETLAEVVNRSLVGVLGRPSPAPVRKDALEAFLLRLGIDVDDEVDGNRQRQEGDIK